jgi:alginate O-acetyltransferase complex protein AlgJ
LAPEPARLVTREEAALREIGRTQVSRPLAVALVGVFLLTIAGAPLAQVAYEAAGWASGRRDTPWPGVLEVFQSIPRAAAVADDADGGVVDLVFGFNAALAAELKNWQRLTKQQSLLVEKLVPKANAILTGCLGAGSEEVYVGRGGWLFYKPDVDYATGPGFLGERVMARRREQGVQPDPRRAILDFKRQLQSRGITLIVMPAPVKPVVQAEALSSAFPADGPALQNPSYGEFKADLERGGVLVFDVAEALRASHVEAGREWFLRTDTHWRPEAVELAARLLERFIDDRVPLPPAAPVEYRCSPVPVTAQGDLAVMLRLPKDLGRFREESVVLGEVTTPSSGLWHPTRSADVLVLGDSFSNIYSLPLMGWGESAGFVEQLAQAMQRPVDAILRNNGAGYAAREMLSHELARGRDRLAGKRVVVWEFAVRELAFGDWRLVDLSLGQPPKHRFFVPQRAAVATVTGTVEAVSLVPRPGRAPYKNHIMTVHLSDLKTSVRGNESHEAVVYLWSMRENVLTPAAHFRPGDRVTVRLRPWSDVEQQYGSVNRSELDDEAVHLQEPCWGEPVTP